MIALYVICENVTYAIPDTRENRLLINLHLSEVGTAPDPPHQFTDKLIELVSTCPKWDTKVLMDGINAFVVTNFEW